MAGQSRRALLCNVDRHVVLRGRGCTWRARFARVTPNYGEMSNGVRLRRRGAPGARAARAHQRRAGRAGPGLQRDQGPGRVRHCAGAPPAAPGLPGLGFRVLMSPLRVNWNTDFPWGAGMIRHWAYEELGSYSTGVPHTSLQQADLQSSIQASCGRGCDLGACWRCRR